MKTLITGASGRIGREIASRRPEDMDIEALIEPGEQHIPPYKWLRTDITDREKILMAVTCSNPDIVVHLAAMTDVDACEADPGMAMRVNRDGAAYVAEACKRCGAKLVYVSTDYVFNGKRGPYTEDDEPAPANVYGRSKLEGERVSVDMCPEALIVRISVPFGTRREHTPHNFISRIIDDLAEGNAIRAVHDQYTTPAFMPELADVIWTLAGKDMQGIVHYGTSDRLSRYDMARTICEIMGFDDSLVEKAATADFGFIAPRPLESGFVTDRLLDILGYPPILFRNAVFRMIEEQE